MFPITSWVPDRSITGVGSTLLPHPYTVTLGRFRYRYPLSPGDFLDTGTNSLCRDGLGIGPSLSSVFYLWNRKGGRATREGPRKGTDLSLPSVSWTSGPEISDWKTEVSVFRPVSPSPSLPPRLVLMTRVGGQFQV